MILSAKFPIKPFKGRDFNHNMAKINCISLLIKLLLFTCKLKSFKTFYTVMQSISNVFLLSAYKVVCHTHLRCEMKISSITT